MAKLTKHKKVIVESVIEKAAISLYPDKIEIVSDGNTLEFVESKKIDSKIMVYYRYIFSETKLGMILPMPDTQLEAMLRNEICKQLK